MRARIAVRTLLVLVFAAANVCSVVVSASATIRQAVDQGVSPGVAPFTVPMLELVSVTGAVGMIVAARLPLRLLSITLVAGAMTVTGIAGVHAYGWFGLVAPIAVQLSAHALDFTFRDPLRIGRGAEQQTERTEQLLDPIERARQIDARSQAERTDWFGRGLAVLAEAPLSQRDVMRVFRDDPHVRVGSGRALTLIRAARKGAETAGEVAS